MNTINNIDKWVNRFSIKVENKIKKNKMWYRILYFEYDPNILLYILIISIVSSLILTFLL